MSGEVAALRAAWDTHKVEQAADIAILLGKITTLSGQIAAIPGVDPDIVALTNEITADTTALHTAANPPADPVVPPQS